jgi:uncharacterized membrane protein YdbT with pleckstrin-like domain
MKSSKNNCERQKKGIVLMNNPAVYIGAIVLGVIGIILGVLYQVHTLGYHPFRAIVALVVGAILLIVGIVGTVMMRRQVRKM